MRVVLLPGLPSHFLKIKNHSCFFNHARFVFRYGAKAAAKLATVRGKDFRHEKTKRKRSYVGGKIDMSSHSIKFSNSDDEN